MESLFVIAQLAGERVALRAQDVESVIEVGEITPIPLAPPHVAGLTALRSRVLTVIDSNVALGLTCRARQDAGTALVCACDGHVYALLVDGVEDVIDLRATAPLPITAPLEEGWSRVATGLTALAGRTILVVDIAALLRGREAIAA